jgi:hypothetical protein
VRFYQEVWEHVKEKVNLLHERASRGSRMAANTQD